MTAETLNFTISDDSAEKTFDQIKYDKNKFIERTFETIRLEHRELHRFIQEEKNNFRYPKIYKLNATVTYAAIMEELKQKNIQIKINQQDIELYKINQRDFKNNKDWENDAVNFLTQIKETSPVFINKLIYVSTVLLKTTDEKSAFHIAIHDICRIFEQKIESENLQNKWF